VRGIAKTFPRLSELTGQRQLARSSGYGSLAETPVLYLAAQIREGSSVTVRSDAQSQLDNLVNMTAPRKLEGSQRPPGRHVSS
jgi:hypothetical protein